MKTKRFNGWLRQWPGFWLLAVAVQSAGRLALYAWFVDETVKQSYRQDVAALFLKGLQFDAKTASILTALPVLLGLSSLVSERSARLFDRIHAGLLAALAAVLAALTLGNVYYFKTYERQFDVFVFGLAEEDTRAVLATMWHDYPVLRGVAAVLVSAWIFARLFAWLRTLCLPETPSRKQAVCAGVLAVLALAVGIRGSVGKFPLRQSAAQISASPKLNGLVANAPTALDWARKERQNSSGLTPVSDSDGLALISRLSGKKAESADLAQFYRAGPSENAAVPAKRPNVALAVMESMGSHLLQSDNPERDLLGRLKTHFDQDWLYTKFVSEGDGTSDSLHRFFVRSPILNLSQSAAKCKNFPSNMFRPYLDAGYQVVYITSGNGGWRDFDSFLRHLGVHEVADENTLKARYPEAKSATWGVPDEFMFRYAAEKLEAAEKSGKPVFVMMMSITNHPPYRLPPPHQPRDFKLTATEKQRFAALAQGTELNEIFNTFRYANDQLGAFVGDVKQRAPHTIIAATGDHNMRAIGYPKPQENALGHAVPFYLYVPPEYHARAEYHPERAGSHKDILPTLYGLSLPGKPYYQNGCNLTEPKPQGMWCGWGYNREVLLTEGGFYGLADKKFYRWTNAETLSAEAAAPDEASKSVISRAEVYGDFLDWQIRKMVSGVKK
ncbi:LTA synthase family protein [Neisseria chenwenguii]|uniref:Phosphoglycerol transferase n=1 Tax=Neisseria chenwenguii TaxID=1853278 RepID=A0A220S1P2_9NEIS|nr:LTA synthase family protein [Neisseria chenwenguii]ASK27399.1 phosphoglycerol transferase [Neisseria chenwenguii]ROV56929.1 LTA synthase family protein [Neisseria chenwenguii]